MLVVVRRGLALPKSMRHQLTRSKRGGELRAGAFGERHAKGGTARGAIEQPKSHLATCCCLLGNGGDLLLPTGERRRRDAACSCGQRCTRVGMHVSGLVG
jgi:hypothetical protein